MNKVIIILLLAITIFAIWTFDNSFIASSNTASVSGTSAVIFAKVDDVSVRAKILVTPKAGTWANISFADGTQKQIGWTYTFEVYLPKTGSSPGNFIENAPGGILLTDQKPFGAAVLSNITDNYFATLSTGSSGGSVTTYWFRVEGSARVTVASYGVAI